jgi:phytoene dehydrogenase-like protein
VAGNSIGDARDPAGRRVVVPGELWRDKILRDHPELGSHLADVLRAIAEPDEILNDPIYEQRRRHYLRGAGPSRWLLVVLSYEQEPARVISAFGNRKDPRSWSK